MQHPPPQCARLRALLGGVFGCPYINPTGKYVCCMGNFIFKNSWCTSEVNYQNFCGELISQFLQIILSVLLFTSSNVRPESH